MNDSSAADIISASRREVGERITAFYASLGLKRAAFAELMGVKYDTMLAYEKGRAEPGSTFFRKLAKTFPDVDISYILIGVENLRLHGEVDALHDIPIFEEVPAGTLKEFLDHPHLGTTRTTIPHRDIFALRVRGDSMHPEIHAGDIIVCRPNPRFISGKIYAVLTSENESTVKQVFKRNYGYDLVPINPDYQSKFVGDRDIAAMHRVIEIQRKLD